MELTMLCIRKYLKRIKKKTVTKFNFRTTQRFMQISEGVIRLNLWLRLTTPSSIFIILHSSLNVIQYFVFYLSKVNRIFLLLTRTKVRQLRRKITNKTSHWHKQWLCVTNLRRPYHRKLEMQFLGLLTKKKKRKCGSTWLHWYFKGWKGTNEFR